MPQQATLYNPQTGDRQAVDVGSQDAQGLFGNNYVLEESYDANTGVSTYAGMNGPNVGDIEEEPAEIDVNESTDLAKGGYKDTFYENAAKTYQGNTNDLAKFKMETIANMDRANEAEKLRQEKIGDDATKGLSDATSYDVDARTEEFRDTTKYQDTLDALNAIEMDSADAWKSYTDLKNGIQRNPDVTSSYSIGMQGKYKEDYLAEATYLEMRADMVQGNLDRIDKRVDRYYTQIDNMRTQQISNFEDVLKMSNDRVFQLEDKEEGYILETLDSLEAKQDKDMAERDDKRALLSDAISSGVDFTALGITMQDDYDTMLSKIVPAIKAEQIRQASISSSGGTTTPTYTSALDESINDYAYQAIAAQKLGTQAEKDASFANLVNTLVEESKGDDPNAEPMLTYNQAQIAIIQKMQELQNQPVTYGVGNGFDGNSGSDINVPDVDARTEEVPEGVNAETWYQKLGDTINPTVIKSTREKNIDKRVEKITKQVEEITQYISIMENKGSLNRADTRALKNARNKLKEYNASLQSYEAERSVAYKSLF